MLLDDGSPLTDEPTWCCLGCQENLTDVLQALVSPPEIDLGISVSHNIHDG